MNIIHVCMKHRLMLFDRLYENKRSHTKVLDSAMATFLAEFLLPYCEYLQQPVNLC